MAAIDELIDKIKDEGLRDRIKAELHRMQKQRKFGLVYENHQPETTLLYDVPVKQGSKVALKNGDTKRLMVVQQLRNGMADCEVLDSHEVETHPIEEIVCIAQFGDPIYPYLQPIDEIWNAKESDLWHILIQADNYHALQLLAYLYPGQVDCIYIDPPYNTGARDWKYNNDYVDTADTYRHSKWLSMMEKRLRLAKQLLNPKDSVLIVTIDEKEYLHLGCLLEEMFPEANIQMATDVINVKGSSRKDSFSRSSEYIFFVMLGSSAPQKMPLSKEWLGNIKSSTRDKVRLADMMRHGDNGTRKARPNLFYPIFVSKDGKKFIGAGSPPDKDMSKDNYIIPDDVFAIWPIHSDGTEGSWGYEKDSLIDLQKRGYLHLGKLTSKGMGISFIQPGWQKRIESGEVQITGYGEDGFIQFANEEITSAFVPSDNWAITLHNATEYGQKLLQSIVGKRFAFPKSIYSTHDTIRFFVANKPNALIVDFFAGSGTTLHAVNLLNAEDGGHRRCIMVTNNEVSDAEAKAMTKKGLHPGDEEWEKLGIAQYVTWPRIVCSILGKDINGNPLKGDYLGGDKENPIHMSDGFQANAIFFKLGFLDKDNVEMGQQFNEMIPLLWMKAGAKGICPPPIDADPLPPMLFNGNFAILTDETQFFEFAQIVNKCGNIEVAYIVTDSDAGYREMSTALHVKETYQLYRDYLDNFRINRAR